jgi:hypothetical protein
MGHVRVKVTYTFIGVNGDTIKATVVGEAMDSGDKATAKAMSVAFRTALLQSLSLPTDEVDPDAHSYERSSANDVLAPEALIAKINQSTTIESLSEVGQYITANKDAYPVGLLDQFRAKFKEQQSKLNPPKLEEELEDVSTTEPARVTV